MNKFEFLKNYWTIFLKAVHTKQLKKKLVAKCFLALKEHLTEVMFSSCFEGLHVLGIFRVGGSKKRMKQVNYIF